MKTMTYKGYTAHVEYDDRDGIFVGRVVGAHSMISFHADTVEQLRNEFHLSIDDYLKICAEMSRAPDKPTI
jgi:predicted HicB family RNase H-like nuclease